MKEMYWHKCPHCQKDKYCTETSMRDHIEDCNQRPSLQQERPCPKCASKLAKVLPASWICLNQDCDYQLGVLTGGKQ